ncbi:MAG: hypothetical protein ACI35W_04860 [Anaeroplasmataceae bacterium]
MAKVKTIEIVDIENVRNEKLRYQKNTLAYLLGFLGIALTLIAAFIALNTYKLNSLTIVKILMNVVIFLFGFLSCEKVKAYDKKYAYVLFGFAAVSILRIFWVPLQIMRHWGDYEKAVAAANAAGDAEAARKAADNALTYFYPQIINPTKQTKGYLAADGYLRATLCIIFLVGSAVAFAFAGYVGYSKARKLEKYLESINVDFNRR